MKMVTVKSGIVYEDNTKTFTFDFATDKDSNIIDLFPRLHKTNIFDNVYWYGYEFKSGVPSNVRTEFIHQLKGLSDTKFNDIDFKRFLINPVIQLGHVTLHKFNTIIYPKSERSQINRILVKYIRSYSKVVSDDIISLELIKEMPKNIKFDWNAFELDSGSDGRFPKWKKKAEKLRRKINNSTEYFSLAKSVPSNLRRYIANFLHFDDDELQHAKQCIDDKNILLVDDINTSGSTLIECLKAIHAVGFPKEIVILTILGKPFSDLE